MQFSKKVLKFTLTTTLAAIMTCTSSLALYAGQVKTNNVNFRSSVGGNVIGTLSSGTKIAILDHQGEWYHIAVNGVSGYVSSQFVHGVPDCDFNLGTGTVTGEGAINVRTAPQPDAEILTAVDSGSTVAITGIGGGWYKVNIDGATGYMFPQYVSISSTRDEGTSRSNDSASANEVRQKVIDYAATFLGTPYVYGGSTPSGFDCSGFTSYVYKNTVRSIPRTATAQRNALTNVSMSELKPADLVFFGSNGNITHTGIYVGNGQFIHSPRTGSSIKYDTLWSGNYNRRFVSGGRVIFDD